MDIHSLMTLLAQEVAEQAETTEQVQTEYALGWLLAAGMIFLGLMGVCSPRLRNKWPKEMREMKAEEAAREKKKAAATKKKQMAKKKKTGTKKTSAKKRK